MPRIRKKTSNRQNTRDRAKITKKVAEHKKKTRRDEKRNVTWKSKKKADPGVPNSFPFKDQVLAELADEKRRNEEAKLARREANRAKAQEEPEEDTPGIASITASNVLSATAPIAAPVKAAAQDADIPELVDTALATLQDVLDRADVVMQVVDARDIQGGRSAWIENLVNEAGGKYALLVNKSDLCPREALQGWLSHLPADTYLYSSTPSTSAGPSTIPGHAELTDAFRKWAAGKKSDEPFVVALMGLPSVGKTSVLNTLLPSASSSHAVAATLPTAAAAKNPQPTTSKPVEIALDLGKGVKVHVIDTPGWEYAEEEEDEDEEKDEAVWDELVERVAGDTLRRNLGRIDRVKDVFPLAEYIFKRSNPQDLMLAYNVPYFQAGDIEAFLLAVARATGRVKKHGDADLEGAARVLLRDWATNSFPYYAPAPAGSASAPAVKGQPDMSAVLALSRTRKEMRAGGKGVIRFQGGEVDKREIILDDDYIAMAESEDEEEEEDDDEEEDDEEDDEEDEDVLEIGSDEGEELELEDGPEPSSGSDVEDEEEEEESEEEEPEPVVINKRKRKGETAASPAKNKKAKRVSFGKNETRTMEARGALKRKRG